ncbi:hypothetical protein BGW39_000380 [Mortierella sp. 14UC]|nr:hypothetical protein BGW39_000380 [Mortierella sp. 14UC]
MTIQGVSLEPVRVQSDEFQEFQQRFDNTLVSLYEVNYAEIVPGYLGEATDWDTTTYYHGTSHCGCVDNRISNGEKKKIDVSAWCNSVNCGTRGIITHGHLKMMLTATEGHYFSPDWTVARNYARVRSSAVQSTLRSQGKEFNKHLSIFVCIGRKILQSTKGKNFYYVQKDSEILPVFLAIVRNN